MSRKGFDMNESEFSEVTICDYCPLLKKIDDDDLGYEVCGLDYNIKHYITPLSGISINGYIVGSPNCRLTEIRYIKFGEDVEYTTHKILVKEST
jgi:hypothetical protein